MTANQSCNPDELEVVEWLDSQFFTEVLQHYEKAPELRLTDLRLSPASAQGDHYASVMFRAWVEYSTDKGSTAKSLIVKAMPEQGGMKRRMVGESRIFQTEIAMYTKVLPKFEAVLREAGEETALCVPCLYHSLEPRQVLVFDDLLPLGYQVIRNRPLTSDELRCALDKLAKWHAVSHKLLKEDPDLFKDLQYNMATLPNFLNQSYIANALPNFIYMLDEVESLKKYKRYFEAMRRNLIQNWADTLNEYRQSPRDDSYYVLCHGDFHIRNLMFKCDSCMLIDFQLSHVGPVVNDFLYAMYTLFSTEERGARRDELIKFYLERLQHTLIKIGYLAKAPTLDEFQSQMIDKRFNEFLLLTTFLPMQIAARKNAIDPLRRRTSMYKDEDYQQEVECLLQRMTDQGYFRDI
ncbi:PREDICTED: uncharacterized protein LOC108621287 [Drosophila arizonae]|uniref:Uncharacterized protein LOC108621287 n=1 Tax=Drosophila arizonae TaxID=7263 RepID=A0ABM1Q3J8_DROAR|nr:PREDICTED: uncharacterized protein LOC108621287 [Drosophila arizonae]